MFESHKTLYPPFPNVGPPMVFLIRNFPSRLHLLSLSLCFLPNQTRESRTCFRHHTNTKNNPPGISSHPKPKQKKTYHIKTQSGKTIAQSLFRPTPKQQSEFVGWWERYDPSAPGVIADHHTFVLPDEFFPCNVCNPRTFDANHAIHCAQCEFIVHRGCLGGWEGLRREIISLNPRFLSPLVPNEEDKEIDSGAEEAAGTRTSIASVEEVGGTSAGTRGQRDSVEIDSGTEDAGGTSMGAKGRGDLGKVIDSDEIKEIDSSTEEREGLVQAPEAAAEIDSGMEDAGGTTAGTRGRRDLGKGIDDVEEINSIVEIDSGVEVTGELAETPEAAVTQMRRLSWMRRVFRCTRGWRRPFGG